MISGSSDAQAFEVDPEDAKRKEKELLQRLFAQLIRFYGLDPIHLYEMSQSRYSWLVALLADEMRAIEAREFHLSAVMAGVHTLKRQDKKSIFSRLKGMYEVKPPNKRPVFIEHNPDLAAAWFASMGVDVVKSGDESEA